MFRRQLTCAAALTLLATTALAADLPGRRAPAPDALPDVFNWTGFYVGANAGYAFSTGGPAVMSGLDPTFEGFLISGGRPRTFNVDREGFTGGGQIGYNQQIGRYVFGLEADASYTDLSARESVDAPLGLSTLRHDLDFLGTVRARVGLAFNRVMIYGTGGFAYGNVETRGAFHLGSTPSTPVGFVGVRSGLEYGWAAGGGIEYAMPTGSSPFGSNAITVKAEALYYDLGRQNVTMPNTAAVFGPGYRAHVETNGVVARVGLNIKFGT